MKQTLYKNVNENDNQTEKKLNYIYKNLKTNTKYLSTMSGI